MRLKDVPPANAYVVFHDAYMNGAMDVWPCNSIELATRIANANQNKLDESGQDECGVWRAYEKLPRVRVWKYHPSFDPEKERSATISGKAAL